jgi:hypothetical protein
LSIAAGVLAALALGEAAVRQVYWHPLVADPVLGAVPAPGETQRFALEGDGRSRWTVLGVRRAAPPDRSRPSLLAVGDSFTEALMIDDADVYTERLETLLGARGIDLPVLNVGKSGFSAADYVALADEYRRRFDVLWTVVQLMPQDVADEAFDPATTHFRVEADGRISLVAMPLTAPNPLLLRVRRHLALLDYGVRRLKEMAAAARAEPPLFFGAQARPPAPPQAKPDPPVEEVLEALGRAYDGRLTLLLLAPYLEPPSPVERRIVAACRNWGWSCVQLRDRFPEFEAQHEAPFGFANSQWGRGHLNAAGHRAAAELLADEIARLRARDLL